MRGSVSTEEEVVRLRAENAELRRQLTIARDNNHRRNVELDALHYVWCDGGCSTGVHRYDGKGPEAITPEIVAAAVRNTERLVKWSETRWARERYEARLNAPAPAHSAEAPAPGSD